MKNICFSVKVILSCLILGLSSRAWLQSASHLYFDGVNDYVETNSFVLEGIGGDFTFEAIIKGWEMEQGVDPTIATNRWSTIAGNTFYLKNNGLGPRLLCFSHGNDEYFIPDNGGIATSLLNGECHHVAIVKSGNDISFYADGICFGTLVSPYYYCDNLYGHNLKIGRDFLYNDDSFFHSFQGVIGQVRFWHCARTPSEIFDNMYASLTGTEPNLLAYWELNEGIDQLVLEKKSMTFDGFLGNSDVIDSADPMWIDKDYCAEDENGGHETNGIVTTQLSETLTLYPNPTNGAQVFILVPNGSKVSNINIYNLNGELVLSPVPAIYDSQMGISCDELSKGLYIVEIDFNSEVVIEKLIIN
ncbi:MAG: T9SS type A sorting domain-containing protein [Crocinitomix sp.]|nr:T9SS type A sorting domain-containing protein [Crocinitomix sp.]